MRPRLLLLSAAAACAVFHVVGVLTARPIWRYAEVASLGLLLAYALASRPPRSRWALGAALAVLLVDAFRTMPAPRDSTGYGWQVLVPGSAPETPSALESALSLCWPAAAAVGVLLVVWRRDGWHRRWMAPGVVGAALIIGYATVRIVGIRSAVDAETPRGNDTGMADLIMAVLPPLVLGVTALALASALGGHGRRIAAIGAALLALTALPLMDTCIATVPMPLYAGSQNAVFAWHAITPTPSLPQPMPALTAMVELTGWLLLVVGLSTSSVPTAASPAVA
ncbi:hypothetical protein [Micromonospora sp. NPDC049274]|uniref:hypothetical protein n=1 Tax=Micromonospora sp. NPDC049274 TaxID=3154829 RepID=UPI00342549EA